MQGTPEPSENVRSLAIADSKGSADAKQAAESAQRRIDIAAEATLRLAEVRLDCASFSRGNYVWCCVSHWSSPLRRQSCLQDSLDESRL